MANPYTGARKKCGQAKIFFRTGDVLQEPLRLQDRNKEKVRALSNIKITKNDRLLSGMTKILVFLPLDNKRV